MEEKANKKPVGLIISIIFNVILIGVIVAGVICGQLFTKKTTNNNEQTTNKESSLVETEVVNKEEEQSVEEKAETKSLKIDDSKDWVYIVKTDTKVESEDENEETYLEYPQINMNMDHIKSLNEKIKNEIIKRNFYTKAEYYLNNKILSLVITMDTLGDNYYIFVYNIDTTDGNILTNEELLYKMGMTEDLNERIQKAVSKVVNEHIDSEDVNYSYAHSTSVNINKSFGPQIQMLLFINGNGKLSAVVDYTTPAGSGGPWGEIVEIN